MNSAPPLRTEHDALRTDALRPSHCVCGTPPSASIDRDSHLAEHLALRAAIRELRAEIAELRARLDADGP